MSTPASGIDLDELSDEVRPQDDLFRHVNGRWLAAHRDPLRPGRRTAPSTCSTTSPSSTCGPSCEEAAAGDDAPGTDERKVGDLWAAFMDVDEVERRDAEPARRRPGRHPRGRRVDRQLRRPAWAGSSATARPALVDFFVDNDGDDATRYVVNARPGGPRPPRRGLLPRGRPRRDPGRLRRARRHRAAPRSTSPTPRAPPAGHGPGDGARRGALDRGRQPRRPQDPQQARPALR